MLTQSQVDKWLGEFLSKLKASFSERLLWVGHHGSWARGEPRKESDIDCVVVVDHIAENDLAAYRDIISSMPDAQRLGSGLVLSITELKQMPRFELVQFFFGRKVIYGSIEGIIDPPAPADLVRDIKIKTFDNLHAARHYLLYPHELPEVVHRLKYPFKNCFYALQSWVLLTQDEFTCRKDDIIKLLDDPVDKEVVRVARDWHKITDDLTDRAEYYIELLERWGRGMKCKLESLI